PPQQDPRGAEPGRDALAALPARRAAGQPPRDLHGDARGHGAVVHDGGGRRDDRRRQRARLPHHQLAALVPGRRGLPRHPRPRPLPLLRAVGVKAVCEHVAGDTPYFSTFAFRNVRPLQPTKFALQALDYWYSELEETPDWHLVLEAADFRRAERNRKVAVVFGFEGAMPVDRARGLARRGGVIGVHMLNMFISGSNTATLDQLLDHVDHFVRLVGPEHVGLGPDCMEQWPVDVYKTLWTGTEAQSLEFHYL